jgi:hypothetical protein
MWILRVIGPQRSIREAPGIVIAALGIWRRSAGMPLLASMRGGLASYSTEGGVCPQLLDASAAALGLEATPPGAGGWLGESPRRGPHGSPTDERDQPLQRVLAVAFLGPVAPGGDDQNAFLREPAARQFLQACPHIVGQ